MTAPDDTGGTSGRVTAAIRARIAGLPPFAGKDSAANVRAADVVALDGLTNESFLVDLGPERLVVRFAGAGTERSIDRRHERTNLAVAATIGIAPELIYANVHDGTLVTRFVDGAYPLDAAALREPQVLTAAVDVLARLHRAERIFRGRRDYLETLDTYLSIAARGSTGIDGPARLRTAALAALESLAPVKEPLCPCHVDPGPANFLRWPGTGVRLTLIDWEYSSMCEPLWDLADLSMEADFDAAQDDAMLARYYGASSVSSWRPALATYKGMLALLSAAWAAARLSDVREVTRAAALERTLIDGLGRACQLLRAPAILPIAQG